MGERPLYSVDPEGSATAVHPANGNVGGPGASSPQTRAAAKVRPKYAVPTDRMKFDTQVQALQANVIASSNGAKPVDASALATYMGVSAATAVLNQAFFRDVGLIEKTGKGTYKPSDTAIKFQQEWSFDKVAAPKVLAPLFVTTWFYETVKRRVAMGPTSVEQMIQTLAGVAETDSSYSTQYGFLLEWLEFVDLISMDAGTVALRDGDESAPEEPAPVDDLGPLETPERVLVPKGPLAAKVEPAVPEPIVTIQRGPAVIDITVSVYATADDLARLTGEQIAALFEGIGKVASVKAALAQD